MGNRLEGKGAVVTGAGRGIGKEVALALAAEGAKVVVVDPGVGRDGKGTESGPANEVVELIKSRGGMAVANYESVADHAGAERIIKSCIDSFGKIDILVNVAGVLRERIVWNLTEDDWDTVLDVHLKGTFNCTKFACLAMKAQKSGRIINTTSDAWRGSIGQANYCAAKGGIVSFSRAVALEMSRYGVTCNVIAPAAATRMTLDEGVKDGLRKRFEAGLMTKERLEENLNMPGPEFIPPIVVYLSTDHAGYISGKVFGTGGGRLTIYSEPAPMKGIYKNHRKLGAWTLDELLELVPKTLGANLPPLQQPDMW